jgi:hypothetical protein
MPGETVLQAIIDGEWPEVFSQVEEAALYIERPPASLPHAADTRRFEFEKHRHAIAAPPEEDALPQAQNSGVAPAQHQADGDEGVGQILAHQVEAEAVEQYRQHHEDGKRRLSA